MTLRDSACKPSFSCIHSKYGCRCMGLFLIAIALRLLARSSWSVVAGQCGTSGKLSHRSPPPRDNRSQSNLTDHLLYPEISVLDGVLQTLPPSLHRGNGGPEREPRLAPAYRPKISPSAQILAGRRRLSGIPVQGRSNHSLVLGLAVNFESVSKGYSDRVALERVG